MKKDFLKDGLGWEDEWVDSVMEQFTASFNFYREKYSRPSRGNPL
jgi:hypothetical protein